MLTLKPQSPVGRMDTRETPAAEAAALLSTSRDICALAMHKTLLTQEEVILAHTGICPLLLPRNREDTQYLSAFFLKGSVWHK